MELVWDLLQPGFVRWVHPASRDHFNHCSGLGMSSVKEFVTQAFALADRINLWMNSEGSLITSAILLANLHHVLAQYWVWPFPAQSANGDMLPPTDLSCLWDNFVFFLFFRRIFVVACVPTCLPTKHWASSDLRSGLLYMNHINCNLSKLFSAIARVGWIRWELPQSHDSKKSFKNSQFRTQMRMTSKI